MKYLKQLAMLLLVFTTKIALAANAFEPSKDDVMMKIIAQVFGGLVPGGGKDAFGNAISTFNGAILIIGGILATYTILAGTLGTAHDGEMLGKKFSSVWIPIRYSVGTMLIIPIVGGYAVIQQLMMWVIIQGVALGGMIWGSYMDQPYQQANTVVQESTKYDVQGLAEKVFLSQVCVKANAKSVGTADKILGLFKNYNYSVVLDSSTNTYNFGDQNGSILGAGSDVCGSVKLADPVANTTVATGPSTSNTGYLGPLDNLFEPADISGINKAHETATKTLIDSMGTLADEVIAKDKISNAEATAFYKKIYTASDAYIKSVKASADAAQVQKQVSNKAKDYGFALAGAYFMNIIVTNNKITTAIGSVPTASPKMHNRSADSEEMTALATKILATGNKAYSAGANSQKKDAENKDVDMSWDGKLVNAVTKYFTHLDFYNLKNDARHPIIILSDMGNTLTDAYVHLLMAVLGISVAGGAIAGFLGTVSPIGAVITGTISNAILTTLGFLALPLMMVLGSAFVASYLIPMLVFIMWIGILVGYALAVVIAIIISPLWIAMHLHPNGDDLTGKGASGYMMVLTMLLKPALMIFGFIASIVLSSVLGEFINKIYFQVFSFSQGDGVGLMGFMKTVFGTAIYIGLMFMFIKKCFSLMGLFADEIFKWIGGHSANIGGHAEHMQTGATGAFTQAAGFMGTKAVVDKMTGAGKSLNDKIKDGAGARGKAKLGDDEKDKKNPKDGSDKKVDDTKKSFSDLAKETQGSGSKNPVADSKTASAPGKQAKGSIGEAKTGPTATKQAPSATTGTDTAKGGIAPIAQAAKEMASPDVQEPLPAAEQPAAPSAEPSPGVEEPKAEAGIPPANKLEDIITPMSDFDTNLPKESPDADKPKSNSGDNGKEIKDDNN